MKLTTEQFVAAVYLFEKANGNKKDEFEEQHIQDSGLAKFEASQLEGIIIKGFEDNLYTTQEERVDVYWCLGKRFNKELIPLFIEWLESEASSKNPYTVYQLLISLGNMGEPVFNKEREGGSAYYETELNMRDAENYLKKTIHKPT